MVIMFLVHRLHPLLENVKYMDIMLTVIKIWKSQISETNIKLQPKHA